MAGPGEIAQTVLREKGQGERLPTCLMELARNEFLAIEPLSTTSRFEGRLERCRGMPTIFVNVHGRGLAHPRARFTLAHELGHFFLHRRWLGPGRAFHDAELPQGEGLVRVEREASEFASACLLPRSLVCAALEDRYPDLSLVTELAERAAASLECTAIRVAGLASARCCFFWEAGGAVRWTAPSADWRRARYPSTGWRGALPARSLAATVPGPFEVRAVSRGVWCPKAAWSEAPLFESAVAAGRGRLILVVDGE